MAYVSLASVKPSLIFPINSASINVSLKTLIIISTMTTELDIQLIQLTIVIEKDDSDEIAGSIETLSFFLSTVGRTTDEVTENLRMLIADFIEHDGQQMDEWKNVSLNDIRFTYEYDVTALFDVFDVLKINSIAELSGINKSLMRQYASGTKNPSEQQAKKIEAAVHQLGERLLQVSVA